MKLLTILARHGTERYADAEEQLMALWDRQLSPSVPELLVVDTALTGGVMSKSPRRTVIGSVNDCWEFSAFDTAMKFIGPRRWHFDLINFTTSAFGQLHTKYLQHFTLPVLSEVARRSVCLGHIDCSDRPMELLGQPSQHWVRTSCFFLSPAEVSVLGSFVSTDDRSRWFSGDPEAPFRPDSPLSDELKRQIIAWLTGQDIGQAVRWHSRITLDHAHLPYFEQKALMVINERLLTLRLAESGCQAIDVTWLGSQEETGVSVDWSTSWEAQLASRHSATLGLTPSATR